MNIFTDFLKRLLLKRHFFRAVIILSSGTAIGQGLLALVSPILTRLYTPNDFGVFAIFSGILSIIVVIASLRCEMVIPLLEEEDIAANLLILSLLIVLGMSTIVGIGVWLLGEYIVRWSKFPEIHQYIWFLPFSVFAIGSYQVFNYWAVRKKAFYSISQAKIAQSLGSILIQVGLGLVKAGPIGLILGQIVGQTIGITRLVNLLTKGDGKALKMINLSKMYQVVRRYYRFSILSSGSTLVNGIGLQAPTLLLAWFYGAQVAGWFALGQRVIALPAILVSGAVAQAYLSEGPLLAKNQPERFYQFFSQIALKLLISGAIPIIVISFSGPWLFEIVFGEEWRITGIYMLFLGPTLLAQFVVSPLALTLVILERQEIQLIWDMARLCAVVGCITLAYVTGLSDIGAIALFSVTSLVSYCALFIMLRLSIKKYLTNLIPTNQQE